MTRAPLITPTTKLIRIWYDEYVTLHSCLCISLSTPICIWYDGFCLCNSISGCNGLSSHLSYPPPQLEGSSVLDTTTGSALPNRYKVIFNPGFRCVCLSYFKFPTNTRILVLFLTISTVLICIDTMRPKCFCLYSIRRNQEPLFSSEALPQSGRVH